MTTGDSSRKYRTYALCMMPLVAGRVLQKWRMPDGTINFPLLLAGGVVIAVAYGIASVADSLRGSKQADQSGKMPDDQPPNDGPFLDISDVHRSRKTLRNLIVWQAICLATLLVCSVFIVLPETLQQAIATENEAVPRWQAILEGLVGVCLLVLYVWGAVQLWQLKSSGLAKYVLVVFAPYFLCQTTPSVSTGLQDYLDSLGILLAGMILFMCWTMPALFEDTAELKQPGTPTQSIPVEAGNA